MYLHILKRFCDKKSFKLKDFLLALGAFF